MLSCRNMYTRKCSQCLEYLVGTKASCSFNKVFKQTQNTDVKSVHSLFLQSRDLLKLYISFHSFFFFKTLILFISVVKVWFSLDTNHFDRIGKRSYYGLKYLFFAETQLLNVLTSSHQKHLVRVATEMAGKNLDSHFFIKIIQLDLLNCLVALLPGCHATTMPSNYVKKLSSNTPTWIRMTSHYWNTDMLWNVQIVNCKNIKFYFSCGKHALKPL